ncbi:MAG: hypothetical protein WC592_00505 [Candidatus Omnitrophota bacterium]
MKNIIFTLIATVLVFAAAEGASRLFVHPGSYDFIERRAMEQSLKHNKAGGEIRILLFGESTMFGGSLYPYSTIDKWLKMYLADLLPEEEYKRVTVMNFARLGVDSRFVSTAFIDLIPYKPDLAVFYTVHNDFIQPGSRRVLLGGESPAKERREYFRRLRKKSAFLNLLNRLIIRWKMYRSSIKDARAKSSDDWYLEGDAGDGICKNESDLLRPDSPGYEVIKKNFENNINRIISAGARNSIPVIFFEGLSKWKGYEPVRPFHGRLMTPELLAAWSRGFDTAEADFRLGQYESALKMYAACKEADPEYALTYYRMGQCFEGLRQFSRANEYYATANDKDHYPIRAPAFVNRVYEKLRLSRVPRVYFIRTQKLFEERSPDGIIDDSLVIDQIHPTIEGQAMMALELARTIYDNGLLIPKDKWRWDRLRSAAEMKKSLRLDEDAEFDICLASAGYVARAYSKAAEFLEQAVKIRPRSVFARSWLAWSYWKDGSKAKAVNLYNELYRKAPDKASVFLDKYPEIRKALPI